jgi:hypothetical protein
LLAIAIFVNGAKGHSALQLSRDLSVTYKTAFVLAHKLREAMAAEHTGLRTLPQRLYAGRSDLPLISSAATF